MSSVFHDPIKHQREHAMMLKWSACLDDTASTQPVRQPGCTVVTSTGTNQQMAEERKSLIQHQSRQRQWSSFSFSIPSPPSLCTSTVMRSQSSPYTPHPRSLSDQKKPTATLLPKICEVSASPPPPPPLFLIYLSFHNQPSFLPGWLSLCMVG